MIYAYALNIKSLNATILETDGTVTLFVDHEPILHLAQEVLGVPCKYSFYRVHDDVYTDNPSSIREALDYIIHTFVDENNTMTDEEYLALPVVCSVEAEMYTQG